MEKKVDIENKYSREIADIKYILDSLEKGRYYENTNVKMDGYLATNIENLKEKLNDLFTKIEYGKESINEELSRVLKEKGVFK